MAGIGLQRNTDNSKCLTEKLSLKLDRKQNLTDVYDDRIDRLLIELIPHFQSTDDAVDPFRKGEG